MNLGLALAYDECVNVRIAVAVGSTPNMNMMISPLESHTDVGAVGA